MRTFGLHNWRHYAIEQECAWNISLAPENPSTGKLLTNTLKGSKKLLEVRDQLYRVDRCTQKPHECVG